MTKAKKKVTATRTEVFAMRLDPQLKYLAEIAARKQRRSLANFVEWSIEQALMQVSLKDFSSGDFHSVDSAKSELWALDEPDRLIRLATNYPDLLTYDEQLIWRVICESQTYNDSSKRMTRFMEKNVFDIELVRNCWPEIKAYSLGSGTREELTRVMCLHDPIPF